MCCEDTLSQALKSRGLRLTPQREMVLRVLHEVEVDASAEEIHARVTRLSPAVDLSTVYRTLDLFSELKLVSAFQLANGDRHYELLTMHKPHFHLMCTSCGESTAISLQELAPLSNLLTGQFQFEANLEHLIIPGICQKCRAVNNSATIAHANEQVA
ncbi:MAG: Fur family transcriptional regulator [Anaerolineae bacterium]